MTLVRGMKLNWIVSYFNFDKMNSEDDDESYDGPSRAAIEVKVDGETAEKMDPSITWGKVMKSDCFLTKEILHRLIMDYFVIEGFKDAAEYFEYETNESYGIQHESISDRVRIRSMITTGNIESAVTSVNNINRKILSDNKSLLFRLHRQEFIELLRSKNISGALDHARLFFLPMIVSGTVFKEEIEQLLSMTLFIELSGKESDESIRSYTGPNAHFFDVARRRELADEVNGEILVTQCHRRKTELSIILRALVAAQRDLENQNVQFPHLDGFKT